MPQNLIRSMLYCLAAAGAWFSIGCSSSNAANTSSSEDFSVSGAAIESIGGALVFSDTATVGSAFSQNQPVEPVLHPRGLPAIFNKYLSAIPRAYAYSCGLPTSPPGSIVLPDGITTVTPCATSGNAYNFYYGLPGFGFGTACGYTASGVPTWSGYMQWIPSGATATCGTALPVASLTSLVRQFTDSTFTVSGVGARIAATATIMNIDHTNNNPLDPGNTKYKTANTFGNFDGDVFPASPIAGCMNGCEQVTFSGGLRTGITFLEHLTPIDSTPTVRADFTEFTGTLTGATPSIVPLAVSETTANGVISRVVTGTVTTYYNNLQVVGTVSFNALTYTSTCCAPVSGTITTSFAPAANVAPPAGGQGALQFVGKTETITIVPGSTCGTGVINPTVGGGTVNITLPHCL